MWKALSAWMSARLRTRAALITRQPVRRAASAQNAGPSSPWSWSRLSPISSAARVTSLERGVDEHPGDLRRGAGARRRSRRRPPAGSAAASPATGSPPAPRRRLRPPLGVGEVGDAAELDLGNGLIHTHIVRIAVRWRPPARHAARADFSSEGSVRLPSVTDSVRAARGPARMLHGDDLARAAGGRRSPRDVGDRVDRRGVDPLRSCRRAAAPPRRRAVAGAIVPDHRAGARLGDFGRRDSRPGRPPRAPPRGRRATARSRRCRSGSRTTAAAPNRPRR